MFDNFIFVDWSANSTPKAGKDSIWIAEAVGDSRINLSNPSTRSEATHSVLRSLRNAVTQQQRTLIGFDFAYSYPLAALQHIANNKGPGDFRALWKTLYDNVRDEPNNANDRYSFAGGRTNIGLVTTTIGGFQLPQTHTIGSLEQA